MKKVLSLVVVLAMVVSCFALTASAGVIESMRIDWTGEFSADGQYFTITSHMWETSSDRINGYHTHDAWVTYDPEILLWDDNDPNCTYVITGNDSSLANSTAGAVTDTIGVLGGGVQKTIMNGDSSYSTISWTMKVIGQPGEVIEIIDDGSQFGLDYTYVECSGAEGGFESYDVVISAVIPEPAAEEDTHTAPATPVAATKDACEACGTEAGVRFLMTVDKTAADFADVTAYGVVISTADGEYKYTADANTKKAETDTAIEYAVVVTGAPAGTTFTATAFLVYNDDCEVAGISGELTA